MLAYVYRLPLLIHRYEDSSRTSFALSRQGSLQNGSGMRYCRMVSGHQAFTLLGGYESLF